MIEIVGKCTPLPPMGNDYVRLRAIIDGKIW